MTYTGLTNPALPGDSVYIGLGEQMADVTGFGPGQWEWANRRMANGEPATLTIEAAGVYILSLYMRENGLRSTGCY